MSNFWICFGFAGQAIFGSRFLVQWLASEKAKKSVIPIAFWWISICGAGTLLVYSIHRRDPVFIVGQCTGFLIYSRNLNLIFREKRNNHLKKSSPYNETNE